METVQTGIRNALLTAGKPYLQRGTNSPYNGDTQTQYFADASSTATWERRIKSIDSTRPPQISTMPMLIP